MMRITQRINYGEKLVRLTCWREGLTDGQRFRRSTESETHPYANSRRYLMCVIAASRHAGYKLTER
jgi:hypothetical protein